MAVVSVVEKETVSDSFFVSPLAVGTTATKIISSFSREVFKGLLIKAPGANDDTPNTASVFIGKMDVTADQAATGGFPLAPGESLTFPLDPVDELYAIATDTNQKLNCILI